MRFYLAEITVSECTQIKPCEQPDYYKHRYEYFKLREKLLPEDAGIAQIPEPHPVCDITHKHHDSADNYRYQHNDN